MTWRFSRLCRRRRRMSLSGSTGRTRRFIRSTRRGTSRSRRTWVPATCSRGSTEPRWRRSCWTTARADRLRRCQKDWVDVRWPSTTSPAGSPCSPRPSRPTSRGTRPAPIASSSSTPAAASSRMRRSRLPVRARPARCAGSTVTASSRYGAGRRCVSMSSASMAAWNPRSNPRDSRLRGSGAG